MKGTIVLDTPAGLHLELSIKEAKELRDILVDILGDKTKEIS